MRHRKHNHQLGVKTAHRTSMLANLCCSLIENGRIKTTLARARALRPTIEKIITLAKKAHLAQDTAKKIHYRRLAISRLRSKTATKKLFDELVEQFATREGGYTRIYKLALPRLGDASEMALIEFVEEAASKKNKKKAKKSSKKSVPEKDEPKEETEKEETSTPVATEVAESDAESGTEDAQGEETAEQESSSDTGEDSATEEVNEQPEVEESAEDPKVEKEDSEESK
ncbi:MAG: 50S ribosomal protein L17 [Opitutales bacterium]